MSNKHEKSMNISTSWTQPWPTVVIDDVQLEMLVLDMLFDEEDTSTAVDMLNSIGICT